jgi:hypothetical protein
MSNSLRAADSLAFQAATERALLGERQAPVPSCSQLVEQHLPRAGDVGREPVAGLGVRRGDHRPDTPRAGLDQRVEELMLGRHPARRPGLPVARQAGGAGAIDRRRPSVT